MCLFGHVVAQGAKFLVQKILESDVNHSQPTDPDVVNPATGGNAVTEEKKGGCCG